MKRIAIMLLLFAALAAGARLMAQDRSAKGFVEDMLENMLRAEGRSVVIDNVSISLTGAVSAGRVEVRDGNDSWLVMEGLSLDWNPLSLFQQSLAINTLSIDNIALLRLPVSPGSGVAAPAEMSGLTNATIKRIHIGKVRVAAAVAGEETAVAVDGSGEIKQAPPEIRLDLDAKRTDGKQGELRAGVVLDPQTRQLTVDVALNEEADGFVAKLLSISGTPSVALAVKAQGTFDDWSGDFSLDLDRERTVTGKAGMAGSSQGTRLSVDGNGDIGRLVPARIADLFRGQSLLVASVLFANGRIDVERVRIDNDALQLTASGPLDRKGNDSNLAVALRAKDAVRPVVLPGTGWLGPVAITDMRADIALAGSLSAPRWSLALAAGSITSNPANLANASVNFAGTGFTPGTQPLSIAGELSGALAPGNSDILPPSALGPFTGHLSAVWTSATRFELSNADIKAGAFAFSAKGTMNPEEGSFALDLGGSTHSPVTGYSLADRLLTGDVRLMGRMTGDGKGGISIEDGQITSDAGAARLAGQLDAQTIALSLATQVNDLSLLHADMTGKAQGTVILKGSRNAPEAVIEATGDGITLLSQPFTQAHLRTRLLLDPGKPGGELDFAGLLRNKPVNIAAKLETMPDGTKVLHDLSAKSGSVQLLGSLRLPSSGVPSGSFTFSAPDLKDVAPLLLMRLAGSVSGTVDLSEEGGSGRLAVKINGRDIDTESFFAETVSGDVVVADYLSAPRPQGQVKLANARLGAIQFASAEVAAQSTGAKTYSVALKATGNDLSADGEAAVAIETGATTATLSRLAGRIRGIRFDTKRFRVRKEGEVITVENAAITIGSGEIRLNGRMAPDFNSELDVASLPLNAFEQLAAIRGLSGSLAGKVQLTGRASSLGGRFTLSGKAVSFGQLEAQGLKPLSLDATGTIASSRIALRGAVKSSADLTASVDGTIDINTPGRLDLRIRGKTGSLAFADRLARQGIRLEGNADLDVRVTGPFASPDVSGTVTLSKATFGDVNGRFILRNAQGRASIANNVLRIISLQGTTGKNGRASLTGTVAFDESRRVDLKARVERGIYYDGTLVNTGYDADVTLSGSLAATPVLSGTVTLRKPKITLSEVPPSALRPLDVRHVHAPAAVKRQVALLETFRGGGGGIDIALNVNLRAADPVSLSGRGLNVTLGGGLKITGTLGAPIATGAFRLERGSLQLLARRLEFERGRLDFYGDLDPRISLEAVSRRTDATINLSISGRASAPEIVVTSTPRMPQEEALARLMFDRSMVQLSPLQIAQIAGYVATLSGGGSSGLLSRLQTGLGVDWLDVTETETGETAVGVGKRLSERLSIGVEQTTKTNTSRVIIDLNVTRDLKARVGAGSDGSSEAGFFFEKDY